jgi:hypothetical protein
MTAIIISNAVLCAVVLVAIVGGHAWAIATQHHDWPRLTTTDWGSEAVPELDLDVESQPMPEVAIT